MALQEVFYRDCNTIIKAILRFCGFSVYQNLSLTQKSVYQRQGMIRQSFTENFVQTAAFVIFSGY